MTVVCRGMTAVPGHGIEPRPVGTDTVFDLASVTKVTATLPLAMIALRDGALRLDDAARKYLPELAAGKDWNASITIRRLLSHSSGLPAWRPYFVRLRGSGEYLASIASESPSYAPGAGFEYSDLGFMLLGWILERAMGGDFRTLARRFVFEPLGMVATGFRPLDRDGGRMKEYAATELGNAFERGMAMDYAEGRPVIGGRSDSFPLDPAAVESFPWREGAIVGQVHDANCHYGLGGVSGHAGLFSTIGDMSRYPAFWDRGGVLPDELRDESFSRQTPPGFAARGLGWALEDDGVACHTGFTGTSIRYSPNDGSATISLTNRVHPSVRDGIADWRKNLAQAAGSCAAGLA